MRPADGQTNRRAVVISLTVVLALLVMLVLADQAAFRHSFVSNSASCAIRQIGQLPRDTDFVAIGSSRVRRGIDMQLIRSGPDLGLRSAFNFGRPGRNAARNQMMAHDILATGIRPRFLYVEVDLEALASSDDGRRLPVMRDAAFLRWKDQWSHAMAIRSRPWLERMHLGLRATHSKLQGAIVNVLSGRYLGLRQSRSDPIEPVCWKSTFDKPTKTNNLRKARRKQQFERRFGDLHRAWDQEFTPGHGWRAEQELFHINQIRQLAHERGIRMVVSRHWAAYQPPLTHSSIDRIKALVPEFVYPHERLVRSSWDGFFDQSHMNDPARRQFTQWLLSQLK